ncbi:MAG: nucleotidyl transferase AbiEii/AbiGii toxin family protein [Candidatus Symbiothrix sp.]|jgi:predicted nucleotidyltransferase component of viral defense system|nr:nucleotidyl transferase AbiEii/AbiGii toxin family protein [Candidatus Symbiothrix sp.]
MNEIYNKQVGLLLDILPTIAEEKSFALHGGTAINLFCLNMPRLSVDIDLTFVSFSNDRNQDLEKIRTALDNIKTKLHNRIPLLHFEDAKRATDNLKIICSTPTATVKIEVNQINRGLIAEPQIIVLCDKAQEAFDRFCEVQTVSFGQLWGGKINAALDRQHPRDLFDVKNLFENGGITEEIKQGFLFFLLCGKRPFHELLNPQPVDQRHVFSSQFSGMTDSPFVYAEFETTRKQLVDEIHKSLINRDKDLLFAFAKGEPIWDNVDYSIFPAIRWKLLNIQKLKENNSQKFKEQIKVLEEILS